MRSGPNPGETCQTQGDGHQARGTFPARRRRPPHPGASRAKTKGGTGATPGGAAEIPVQTTIIRQLTQAVVARVF